MIDVVGIIQLALVIPSIEFNAAQFDTDLDTKARITKQTALLYYIKNCNSKVNS